MKKKETSVLSFCLHIFQNLLLELPLDLLTRLVSSRLAMKSKQSTKIKLGCLEQLDFADIDVLQRVDAMCGLFNLSSKGFWDELSNELVKRKAGRLASNNLHHLLADLTNLGALSICGLFDLVGSLLGKGNDEEANEIVVSGLDRRVGLDQCLPLANQRTELVGCEIESVKVSEAVLALDFIDAELDFAESMVFVFLEIGEGDFENATFESVVGVLHTGSAVDKCLADLSVRKR